jgi:hypothetical protein
MMSTQTIGLALVVLGLSVWAAAQDNSREQPATTPAPAFGQSAPILNPENPPISGLDEPGLDLKAASRSFIAPALQVSQSADSNAGNELGTSDVTGVTRFLGALDLQKFWAKSDFLAEYVGGGAYYSGDGSVRQMQAVGVEGVTRWRTGQGTIRDSFSYLPEGALGGAYSGLPGLGLTSSGIGTGGIGGGLSGLHNLANGSVGLAPRLSNTAIADIVQAISPRSAFTVAGGFSNAHYFDNTLNLLNSDQTIVEAGYSHLFSRRDQIAGVYGYQLFRFPQSTGGQVQNHIAQVRWSHTITGRFSLIAGVGPQYTILQSNSSPDQKHWSVNARAQLRYRLPRTSFVLGYEKYTSSGSGFYAGADSQIVRLGVHREIGRTWTAVGNLGYSHNKSLQSLASEPFPSKSYDEGSVGATLRKHIGRVWDVFMVYRFADLGFDSSASFGTTQRHIGAVGVEWHPTPTRIE